MKKYVEDILDEAIQVHRIFASSSTDILINFAKTITDTFMNGGKILIFGNGGSAGDSQHIAAEFVGRFVMERPSLPAIALTTDTSLITAVGNDYTFDDIFERQVSALVNENDIVWGISTSGNSENIIKALHRGVRNGAKVLGFTGKDGGRMNGLCDHILIVDSQITARIQEIHILAGHIICSLVDEMMFGRFISK